MKATKVQLAVREVLKKVEELGDPGHMSSPEYREFLSELIDDLEARRDATIGEG